MNTPVHADVYTHGHHESVLRSHRWRTAQNSAAYLLPHLTPGQSLLDVGCGPGSVTIDLAARVAPGRVVGVDVSAKVVDVARTAAADAGTDVTFDVADAYELPFPDGSFDVVHAHQVLQHVADPVRALREMRRVCRPGGVIAVRDSDYAGFTWFPQLPELDEWLALYRRTAYANGGEPDAGRRLLSWAQAADLTDVTPTASTWCFANDEDRAWADRVTGSTFASSARGVGATDEDLQRLADGWRRWAAAEDGWFVVLHAEILAGA